MSCKRGWGPRSSRARFFCCARSQRNRETCHAKHQCVLLQGTPDVSRRKVAVLDGPFSFLILSSRAMGYSSAYDGITTGGHFHGAIEVENEHVQDHFYLFKLGKSGGASSTCWVLCFSSISPCGLCFFGWSGFPILLGCGAAFTS